MSETTHKFGRWVLAMLPMAVGYALMPDGPWYRRVGAAVCVCIYAELRRKV